MLNSISRRFPVILMCCGVLGLMGCVSGSGDAPPKAVDASISIALTDPVSGATLTNISSGKPAKVSATVRDTSGSVVPNAVVTFSTSATLATMTPASGTALTNTLGVATILIDAANLSAAGATTITATVTLGTTPVSGFAGFGVIATSTGVTGIGLTLTSPVSGAAIANISVGNPANVTAVVRDSSGVPVPNTVVTFNTTATLVTMTPASGTALTDASGMATIQIDPTGPLVAGATTITATATLGGVAVSGGASFSVTATNINVGAASVGVALVSPGTGGPIANISAVNPGRVVATLRDAAGALVPNAVVTFSTTAALATMIPAGGTALTDASGVASIQLVGASAAAAGAGTITATATVGSTLVSGAVNFSVIATNIGAASITVTLTDPATGVAKANISSGKPARVTASVKDASGAAVPNTVVTFNTTATLVTMTPASGTALTDASGMATIQIDPTGPLAAGAANITATATVGGSPVSGSAAFSVSASSVGVPGLTVALTDSSTGIAVSSISPGSPAKVKATVRNAAGSGVPNTVVTFSTTVTLATMTPSTGTALTDSTGVATILIDAASLTAAGATTISATATVDGVAVSASAGFSVSAANAGLSNMTVGTNPLSPYATTSVSVTVTGVPLNTPVTINFASLCASTGKATLPASVQTTNGIATATYTDKGCASTDTITASVAGLAVAKTITLKVNSPGAASIQFVSATPTTIVLKGTGGAGLVESSLIKFRVVDSNNQPVSPAVNVTFDLTTRTGGILLDGLSGPVTKQTDANGEASVTVQSGSTPTAVWVNASLGGTSLVSQSNQLRISTGRPTQDRFSLSLKDHDIEGLRIDGVKTSATVITSDRLGNPVPDGTAINFISGGGQIEPSCATLNGTCSVTFTSANPRPANGRITVVAYTVGEESFIDANGNNRYDAGEAFNDLGEVFIDSNENRVWDAGEQTISFSSSNSSPCNSGISTSPYAPGKAGTCDGAWGSAHVRQSDVIALSSGSAVYANKTRPPSTFVPGTDVTDTTFSMGGTGQCTAIFTFYAFDQNRNPLPVGTQLTSPSIPAALGTVTLSPDKVQDSNSPGGTEQKILISKPQQPDLTCVALGSSGVPLSISFKTPIGTVATANFTIKD